jgi:hypothetical protein
MATSPLFGWEEPDDTDLVKDGAAAIRTLGNAIDTSMGDLLGGTTGQVLSKNSNTNMDFTWVTSDDANAIQNTIVDAKGDLISATGSDVPARLAVGSNGETLVADSAAATGLRYQVAKNQNGVYNSSMDIAQRGTTFTTVSGVVYTLDRWSSWASAVGSSLVTTQEAGTATSRYSAKLRRSTGNTNTGGLYYFQSLETADSYRFQGQTVTLSFYAKAGANFSAASSILVSNVATGTGTDQILYNYTGTVNNTQNNTLTTSWQRFTQTVTLSASATEVSVSFLYTPVGTAGADDSFFVTGIQLEVGSVATSYNRMSGSIQGELAACQRYYNRYLATSNNFAFFGNGTNKDTTNAYITVSFPVEMRVKPTSVDTVTAADYRLQYGATGFTLTSLALGTVGDGTKTGSLYAGVASGLTTSGFVQLLANNNSTAYVGFSAEL